MLKKILLASFVFLGCFHEAGALDEVSWRQDIDYFAQELPKRHIQLFYQLPRSTFESELLSVRQDLPKLSDKQVQLRLQQIAAQVGDLHTRLILNRGSIFPITLAYFGDEVHVVAVLHDQLKHLLGASLVGIDNANINDIVEKASTLISAENKFAKKFFLPSMMRDAESIHFLKITQTLAHAKFKFQSNGKILEVELDSLEPSSSMNWIRSQTSTPLSRSHPTEIYWYKYLDESRALYINYARCEDRKDLPFRTFVKAIANTMDQVTVDKVILDLRTNPGGREDVILPLIYELKKRNVKVMVLIGNGTFSSAFGNALTIKHQLNGVLVGEPTGQKPNAFGEVETFTLPNSRIKVQFSTKYWRRIASADPDALYPDLAVETSIGEYMIGMDTVLEKALVLE